MNTEEITHILKHLLPHSGARFLGVFASVKPPPLNSIQSLVQCCYVSNIESTGKGGSHWGAFFTLYQIDQNFLMVLQENLMNLAFHFQNPFKYFTIPTISRPLEPSSVGISVYSFSITELTTIHFIQYVKNSQHFHMFVQHQLFLHLFIMHTKE